MIIRIAQEEVEAAESIKIIQERDKCRQHKLNPSIRATLNMMKQIMKSSLWHLHQQLSSQCLNQHLYLSNNILSKSQSKLRLKEILMILLAFLIVYLITFINNNNNKIRHLKLHNHSRNSQNNPKFSHKISINNNSVLQIK